MAQNKARIRVAQVARVYLAPVGTPAPIDAIVAMAAAWREVGYFTPDSLSWSTDPSFEQVRSHQSNFPTRTFQTEDNAALSVDLQEWSADNFKAVYGGGTVTPIAGQTGQYRFAPPQIGGRQQVAACVEIIDGALRYRRIIPAAEQNEGVEQSYERGSESTLPLRLAVVGSDLGDAWYDLVLDEAFAPDEG
jgi:hypothetical protein